MNAVVVLNASYEPHQTVSLEHAVRMLVRRVAVVVESVEGAVLGPYPRPTVLRLVRYVYARWLHEPSPNPQFTFEGIRKRDRYTCLYCGRTGRTVDHVVPKSRGGRNTWENCATACESCNHRKGSRSLAEAGMRLAYQPYDPSAR